MVHQLLRIFAISSGIQRKPRPEHQSILQGFEVSIGMHWQLVRRFLSGDQVGRKCPHRAAGLKDVTAATFTPCMLLRLSALGVFALGFTNETV
jgi:hypothetical protein